MALEQSTVAENYFWPMIVSLSVIVAGWIGWSLKTLWMRIFPHREKLCVIRFGDDAIHRLVLPTKNGPQTMIISIRSKKEKTIDHMQIGFGSIKSSSSKFLTAFVNRFIKRREFFGNINPDWLDDVRTPRLETHQDQPKILRWLGASIISYGPIVAGNVQASVNKNIQTSHVEIHDNICVAKFKEPVTIPSTFPYRQFLRIDLSVRADDDWKGFIQLLSNVPVGPDRIEQQVITEARVAGTRLQ